jgi:hypothetical protein
MQKSKRIKWLVLDTPINLLPLADNKGTKKIYLGCRWISDADAERIERHGREEDERVVCVRKEGVRE